MSYRLTSKIMMGLVLLGLFAGITGCGSKKVAESAPSQSQAPTDSMQKAYSSSRPGASAQSR